MHVEQVLGDVPPEQRCQCKSAKSASKPRPREESSFWKRLFG